MTTPSLSAFLSLLGAASDDEALESFLRSMNVHDRPKTVAQLEEEDYIEDDDEADIEYELAKASKESMIVESERHGFCLIFKTRQDYSLVYRQSPPGNSPFVLEQIAFFEKGIQIYQRYQGVLPGGFRFGLSRNDQDYVKLGQPIAIRAVYETPADLFLIDDCIVNFGFNPDGTLAHVHVRNRNIFDDVMLAPNLDLPKTAVAEMVGGHLIGQLSSAPDVQAFFRAHGIDEGAVVPGACPEEITGLTKLLGITVYFSDAKAKQRVSSIAYKRRGDLGSKGYSGSLPMGFAFGDAPQTLFRKAEKPPLHEHPDDQLVSYFWQLESGFVMQAVCSLIDWQLYRVIVRLPSQQA